MLHLKWRVRQSISDAESSASENYTKPRSSSVEGQIHKIDLSSSSLVFPEKIYSSAFQPHKWGDMPHSVFDTGSQLKLENASESAIFNVNNKKSITDSSISSFSLSNISPIPATFISPQSCLAWKPALSPFDPSFSLAASECLSGSWPSTTWREIRTDPKLIKDIVLPRKAPKLYTKRRKMQKSAVSDVSEGGNVSCSRSTSNRHRDAQKQTICSPLVAGGVYTEDLMLVGQHLAPISVHWQMLPEPRKKPEGLVEKTGRGKQRTIMRERRELFVIGEDWDEEIEELKRGVAEISTVKEAEEE